MSRADETTTPPHGSALGSGYGQTVRASEVGVLIDGEDYFTAVHEALARARRQVLIVGWDFDSRVHLRPGEEDLPLGRYLARMVKARPELEIFVLTWDHAPIYVFEREPGLRWKMKLGTPSRLVFEMDDRHPMGASQHEKIVVVDDAVAFVGGLDLCDVRWDTREHRFEDERRVDVHGRGYHPHHDVTMLVTGAAAARLGANLRERWKAYCGRELTAPGEIRAAWPARRPPDLTDTDVTIVRTMPPENGGTERKELEQVWLDSIAAAERTIYVETPYFTSDRLARALASRLQEPGGPEVVMVTADDGNGWLEQHTMTVLRDRRIRELREADPEGRFTCRVPVVCNEQGERRGVNVHAKVCIVDDRLVRVGSGNLTNRSLGLDRECDLVLAEAGDGRVREFAQRLRTDLLSEHLGCSPARLEAEIRERRSLIGAIEALTRDGRSLVEYEPPTSPLADRLLPREELIDPGRPLQPSEIGSLMISDDKRRSYWRYVGLGWWSIVAVVVVLANSMDWVSYRDLSVALAQFGTAGVLPGLAVIATFVLSGLLLVPVTLMIINAGILFGPWLGSVYALAGAFVSAAVYWWMGRRLGRHSLDRLAGPRLRTALQAVARRGVVAVAGIRLVPIAPHVVVGLVAGAARIAFRDYMLGTILAMAPGSILLVVLGDRIESGVIEGSWSSLLPIVGLAIAVMAVAVGMQRLFGRGAVLYPDDDAKTDGSDEVDERLRTS